MELTPEQVYTYWEHTHPGQHIPRGHHLCYVYCTLHGGRHKSCTLFLDGIGGFRCHSCDKKGNLIQFEMLRSGCDWRQAQMNVAAITGAKVSPSASSLYEDLGEPVAIYDYRWVDGKTIFQKRRYEPPGQEKTFRIFRPVFNGSRWTWVPKLDPEKGPKTQRPLYNQPDITTANLVNHFEGEKCVEAASNAGLFANDGFKVAYTTSFDGAWKKGQSPKWLDSYNPYYTGKVVFIYADNDAPGQVYAEWVATGIYKYAHRVKIITFPELPEGGDVADYLASHTVAELEEKVKTTPDWKPDPAVADTCGLKLKQGTEIVEREQVWEVPDFIPGETLTVVIGEIGFGKTRMCVSLCADISRGRIPVIGGERTSGNVLVISNEDSEARLREMFVGMDGDLEKLYVEDEDTDLPWNLGDIASLEARIAQTQADIVVIDSLSTYRPDGVNLWSHSEVAPYLVQLRKLANRRHCAIVLVHHDNKTVTDDPIRKAAGTKGIPGTARHNILVGIDKDGDPDNDRVAANFKTNLAKNRNKAYRFQLLPSFRWNGEVATTAREVLRAQAELDQTARQVRGEQTRKEKEEREARRRDQAASALMTEIDRRTLTHEPAMLKTDAEAFLMAKGFKRDTEVRPAIASGRFKEIPIKGKGNPVELHRSGSHIESAAEIPPSQNANKHAGPEKSEFGGPHLEHTAQIDPSRTRMNSGDYKPAISAADSNGNRSANINSAPAEKPNGRVADAGSTESENDTTLPHGELWPQRDPITNRELCHLCWHGLHHSPKEPAKQECDCHCLTERSFAEANHAQQLAAKRTKRKLLQAMRDDENNPLRASNPEYRPPSRRGQGIFRW